MGNPQPFHQGVDPHAPEQPLRRGVELHRPHPIVTRVPRCRRGAGWLIVHLGRTHAPRRAPSVAAEGSAVLTEALSAACPLPRCGSADTPQGT